MIVLGVNRGHFVSISVTGISLKLCCSGFVTKRGCKHHENRHKESKMTILCMAKGSFRHVSGTGQITADFYEFIAADQGANRHSNENVSMTIPKLSVKNRSIAPKHSCLEKRLFQPQKAGT